MHDARDAIVRVDAVTICGIDLHISKGDVPEVVGGRILGHETIGTVLELGDAVTGISEGGRVLLYLRLAPSRRPNAHRVLGEAHVTPITRTMVPSDRRQ